MRVTFLLSAYDRPQSLWVSLGSLLNQSVSEWNAVVLVNHPDLGVYQRHLNIVKALKDSRISIISSYREDPKWTCYHSSELAALKLEEYGVGGDWLCFPSDDSYYVPEFIERMTEKDADLVYCDCLYDKRLTGKRALLITSPFPSQIDKTCFLVKRDKFIGFPDKEATRNADGEAVLRMIQMNYRHRKVDECLAIHN
jgi:hypothetical protein